LTERVQHGLLVSGKGRRIFILRGPSFCIQRTAMENRRRQPSKEIPDCLRRAAVQQAFPAEAGGQREIGIQVGRRDAHCVAGFIQLRLGAPMSGRRRTSSDGSATGKMSASLSVSSCTSFGLPSDGAAPISTASTSSSAVR
jgi:hypothetical protein